MTPGIQSLVKNIVTKSQFGGALAVLDRENCTLSREIWILYNTEKF